MATIHTARALLLAVAVLSGPSSGEPTASGTIPNQIIMTHKYTSLEEIERVRPVMHAHITKVLKMNPEMTLRYMSSGFECLVYLREHFPHKPRLYDLLNNERTGNVRGDICRMLILVREGGYYIDTDFDPLIPLKKMVPESEGVTLATAIAADTNKANNVFVFATPGNAITKLNLHLIEEWYFAKSWHMGPETLTKSIRAECGQEPGRLEGHDKGPVKCEKETVRFFRESKLDCATDPVCADRKNLSKMAWFALSKGTEVVAFARCRAKLTGGF